MNTDEHGFFMFIRATPSVDFICVHPCPFKKAQVKSMTVPNISNKEKIMPAENQPAPDFQGVDDANQPVKLSDHRGKWVVLYFYPKALTPG